MTNFCLCLITYSALIYTYISSNAADASSGSFSSPEAELDRNNGPIIMEDILEELKPVAVNLMSHMITQRWRSSTRGRRESILPDLPDPLPVDGEADFDYGFLSGLFSLRAGHIVGLSTITDNFTVQLTVPQKINFIVNATEIATYGDYIADIELYLDDALVNSTGTGAGCLIAKLREPYVNVNANILINGITDRMSITSLTIDLGFESLFIRADGFELNGYLFDWEWFNANGKPLFDWAWSLLKPEVETGVKDVLNERLKDCPLTHLIGGDFSCLLPPPLTLLNSLTTQPTTSVQLSNCSWPGTTPPPETTTIQPLCSDTIPCPFDQYCEFESGYPHCRCRDRLYSVEQISLSDSSVTCLRIPGATCLLNNSKPDYQSCVHYSTCTATNSTHGRCKCQAGHVGTNSGQCEADIGQSCDEEAGSKCHSGFMLDCQQGTCTCASPELIYEVGAGCVARLRQPCHILYGNNDKYLSLVRCAEGLECVQVEGGRSECQIESSVYSQIVRWFY